MSAPCVTCGIRPRKSGRSQCGHCSWLAEDSGKARIRRREYKRRIRRLSGAESRDAIHVRAKQRSAEREARRVRVALANAPERKPWLRYPRESAARYQSRYDHDPAFAAAERIRTTIRRFTHPESAAKVERGKHWRTAAARSDGSVTRTVVRRLLHDRSCYLCGTELTAANRTIDHRIALARGGDHTAGNLAACCRICKRGKDAGARAAGPPARRPTG